MNMSNNTKKILKLSIADEKQSKRINKPNIIVDTDGILEDKFYKKNKNRSILLISTDSYNLAYKNNINIKYGDLGENILVNFNLQELKIGQRLQVGDTIILEISQYCPLCNGLSKVHKLLPNILKDNRGIFAKAIKGGTIYKDAPISSLN
jgi:MOSC domain-containing protein YiiM